jgi:hypothetical protein
MFDIIGNIISAYGSNYDGRMAKKYYEYLAALSEQQAGIVLATGDKQASSFQDEAARALGQVSKQSRQVQGAQRAALAKNGLWAGGATAEDLLRDTLNKEKLDEMAIRFTADQKSYATRLEAEYQAQNLRNQADTQRKSGANAFSKGQLGMWASLLQGAGSLGTTVFKAAGAGG